MGSTLINGWAGGDLRFWEHPDMTQIMEFMCLECGDIHYLQRKKNMPYPVAVQCAQPECRSAALPVQEKRDWLASLAKRAAASAGSE